MGADNRCDGDARERAEERGREEVEHHGADERYSYGDEVHALLPVSLEDVDVEEPNQALDRIAQERIAIQGYRYGDG